MYLRMREKNLVRATVVQSDDNRNREGKWKMYSYETSAGCDRRGAP